MASASPDSYRRHHRRRHPVLRLLRLVLRAVPPLLAVLVAVLLYAGLIGVPPPLVNHLLRRIESAHGLRFEADRVFFHPLRGLSVQGLRYPGRPGRVRPLLEAKQARVHLSAWDLLRGRHALQGLRVRDAALNVEPESTPFGPAPAAGLLVDSISADLRFAPNTHVTVRRIDARLLNLRLRGRGEVETSGARAPDPARVLRLLESPPPGFDAWLKALRDLQLEGEPEVNVQFHLVPSDWGRSSVQVEGTGGASKLRGIRFDGWALAGEVRDGAARVDRLALQEGTNRVEAGGTYTFEGRVAEGSVTSSLPASLGLGLIPIPWRDKLREAGFFFEGRVSCNAHFGPSAISNLLSHGSGTVSVQRAEAKGVWIESADLQFTRTPESLRLADIRARIGPATQRGQLQGDFTYHLGRGAYEGQFDGHVDFHALLPVLSEDMVELVRNASFPNQPAHANVRFRRTGPAPGQFDMNGQLRATNFLWRGSFVQTLDTGLLYTNRTTVLAPFHVVREEGRVDGSIAVNGFEKRVDLALTSSVDAQAAGRAAGRTLENILGHFRFEGPSTARVDGVVFWGATGGTRLTADVTARQAGYKALLADRADFTVVISNSTVAVKDLRCDLFGGTLEGWFETPRVPSDPDRAYSLFFEAREIQFRDLMVAFRQEEGEIQRGRLSGYVALSGFLNRARSDVASGAGRLLVRDGMLLRIGLFGGLSRQLSRVISGLGFATQTDFSSDFLVLDRKIHMPTAQIEGDIISLDASGQCGFDQTLDYEVRVKLLRNKTGVGKLVQFVTSPIFWLLEFDLEGTLDRPEWTPRTLPKELFGK